MLHPSSCSWRGLAQFGNPCAACTKGQLTFLWEVSCSREILSVFSQLYLPWEREQPVLLRHPLPTEPLRAHTAVCHLQVFPCSQVGVQLAWKISPCIFPCSGKLAPALAPSSNLLGLLLLLSFQSRCFVDHEILKGTHCAASRLLCLAAHHVPWDVGIRASEGLSPTAGTTAALWGLWGAHVTQS